MSDQIPLHRLPRGHNAQICGFDSSPDRAQWVTALQNSGFAQGDQVEILAHGPFGASPISVRLDRRIIGLRADEAACILVETSQADEAGLDTNIDTSLPLAAE